MNADGHAIREAVFDADETRSLRAAISAEPFRRSRAGARHVLGHECIARIAGDARLLAIASRWLGGAAIPFKATLFDKTPESNWPVAWHQDTVLPLMERNDAPGWGPWSEKDGVLHARAPFHVLEGVVALRLQLDDSTPLNGPLRVLPGTHADGILGESALDQRVASIAPLDCVAAAGSVVVMRPLIIHSSARLKADAPRRVIHIEYARSLDLESGLRLRVA